MRYVTAGGLRLSAVGVGTWQFGSRDWGYGKAYADKESHAIVDRALDLGVNLIDTAEIYAMGESERIVGRTLGSRRAEAFVASKVLPVVPLAPVVAWRGRESRKRLGIDAIDLYQLHWPNPAVPIGLQVAGLRSLLDEGVVRHVGVSNYSLSRWQEAEAALGGPVITNQVQYSLAVAKAGEDLVPWAAANDRIVIAYSPLAQGVLSGRFDGTNPPSGVRLNNPLFLPDNLRAAGPLLAALREIAATHDATPAQVALAWVIARPNVVAIPGASSVQQLEQNVAAADIELTEDQQRRLTEASDAFTPVRGPAAVPQLLRQRLKG